MIINSSAWFIDTRQHQIVSNTQRETDPLIRDYEHHYLKMSIIDTLNMINSLLYAIVIKTLPYGGKLQW